jgi:hypothetical protein
MQKAFLRQHLGHTISENALVVDALIKADQVNLEMPENMSGWSNFCGELMGELTAKSGDFPQQMSVAGHSD